MRYNAPVKTISGVLGGVLALIVVFYLFSAYHPKQDRSMNETATSNLPVNVTPIEHATLILTWGDTVILADPTTADLLKGRPQSNIVLVTDIHPDHFSTSTLAGIVGTSTVLVVPQAVADQLPAELKA